jgi:16S rRNA (cytosine1402-N4)-methyltransferase
VTEDPPKSGKPPRRPRYRGTHPRSFAEKYKERDPGRFPDERTKVLAAGKTPAGSHVPAMVREVLEALAPKAGDFAVDATLGYGGHATELLSRILPGGRLLALDVDPIELPKAEARLAALAGERGDTGAARCVRSNFAGLRKLLEEDGRGDDGPDRADVILADLGVSSMQLDDPARGFSWKRDTPLDLRMNPDRGQPAGILLLKMKREGIEDLLRRYGDEPEAAGIAAALWAAIKRCGAAPRQEARGPHTHSADTHLLRNLPLPLRTSDLAAAVESAYQGRNDLLASEAKKSSLQRTFQAIRVHVNDELTALAAFLRDLPVCLAPGGRVAILTFHSGEDRLVKKAFAAGLADGTYAEVSREVVRASPEEQRSNPRSRSAKLRRAVRAP